MACKIKENIERLCDTCIAPRYGNEGRKSFIEAIISPSGIVMGLYLCSCMREHDLCYLDANHSCAVKAYTEVKLQAAVSNLNVD